MDYLTHAAALEAIVRTVEQDVIGRVDDAYARSQLWSATGILANVARELAAAAQTSGTRPSTDVPSGDDLAVRAATLLEEVRAEVAAQRSLHYRKATTGAK